MYRATISIPALLSIIFLITNIRAFRLRLYYDSLYLGMPDDQGESPIMLEYSLSDRFETEFVKPDSAESTIRVKNTANKVLTSAKEKGSRLVYRGDEGGEDQHWKIIHGRANSIRLKNQNLCLEYIPEMGFLNLEVCTGSDNQLFLRVEDDDEDHGLATQQGVTCNKRKTDHGMRD